MKTLFILIATVLLSITVLAGEHPDKYCAKMRDGKLTVVYQGKPITSEVMLVNGTRIQVDGTITKKDGTVINLKEGECIDNEGKIMAESHKKKTDKEK